MIETFSHPGNVTVVNDEPNGYIFNQTMLRVRDPTRSVDFYTRILGMTLLRQFDFPKMNFSLYFLSYVATDDRLPPADDALSRAEYIFRQKAVLELTHNWGTEANAEFSGYHNGNSEPRGFGHIGITVPDVYEACARFQKLGVEFVKKPDDGQMKGLGFIRDPDGYWIEILSARALAVMIAGS